MKLVTVQRRIVWSEGLVAREERARVLGHRGATVWLTGLPASGKSTIGAKVEQALIGRKKAAYRLDGDNLRYGLNGDLGFSAEDRAENVRRAGEACLLLADAGLIVIACFVSPFAADRAKVQARHEGLELPFLEVFIDAPLAVTESRDPKGHYKKARAGEMKGFTGVDDPYEPPTSPALRLATDSETVDGCVERLIELLASRGVL